MKRNTGEGKVDYSFEYYWSSALTPWERKVFPPAGTMGLIRFYNFDIESAVIKPGHVVGFTWLGQMALQESLKQNNDPIFVIGSHSNTGNKKHNFQLAEARAASVANLLAEHGIDYSRMDIMGSTTLDRDSKGEVERWRAVSVMFTAQTNQIG
jgi:outer membrane protein OmpA-like peptidoglycan-associated protein